MNARFRVDCKFDKIAMTRLGFAKTYTLELQQNHSITVL
jgi:hypothetical protein